MARRGGHSTQGKRGLLNGLHGHGKKLLRKTHKEDSHAAMKKALACERTSGGRRRCVRRGEGESRRRMGDGREQGRAMQGANEMDAREEGSNR